MNANTIAAYMTTSRKFTREKSDRLKLAFRLWLTAERAYDKHACDFYSSPQSRRQEHEVSIETSRNFLKNLENMVSALL